ncbi:MAG: hypothetical protein WBG28_00385, partial [Desulfobulbales bacterium]
AQDGKTFWYPSQSILTVFLLPNQKKLLWVCKHFTLMTDRDKHFHENNKNRAASQNEFNWQPIYIKGAGLAPGMSSSGKAGFG